MKGLRIGADPEFVYELRRGMPIYAGEYQEREGYFGTDGRRDTAELRPGSEEDVISLVAKIREILTLANENLAVRKFRWLAGAWKHEKPLGGHIHVSHANLIFPNGYQRDRGLVDSYTVVVEMLLRELLDTIIGIGFGSTLEDNLKEEQNRRRGAGYGVGDMFHIRFPGDDGRRQFVGLRIGVPKYDRVEYRTPPSWLVSPEVALIYLGAAKLCALLFFVLRDGIADIERMRETRTIRFEEPFKEAMGEFEVYATKVRHPPPRCTYYERVAAVSDLLEFIASIVPLTDDCRKAIDAYHIVAPLKVDWDADIKRTWKIR